MAIVLHGRAQSPETMQEIVTGRLDVPDVTYLAPAAHDASWYPSSFLVALERNEPHLSWALERVLEISAGLEKQGFPASSQVLIGFSQGACLACELVHRIRRRFGAVIALTGGVVGPPGTTFEPKEGAFAGMPVLLGGAEQDPFVPAWRMRETADVFAASGADVSFTLYPGAAHEVPDDQIARARAMLVRQLLTARERAVPAM